MNSDDGYTTEEAKRREQMDELFKKSKRMPRTSNQGERTNEYLIGQMMVLLRILTADVKKIMKDQHRLSEDMKLLKQETKEIKEEQKEYRKEIENLKKINEKAKK